MSATSASYKSAGLPNIWGGVNANSTSAPLQSFGEQYSLEASGAFSVISGYQAGIEDATSYGTMMRGFTFNATQCSTIYKDINTVQPPSFTIRYIIKY